MTHIDEVSIQRRVQEWGITMECSGGELAEEDNGWEHYAWTVMLKGPDGTMITPFKMGTAHKGRPPEAAEVLDSLRSEASTFYQGDSFEDYCSEFGLDTNSRKEERGYHALMEQGRLLKEFLGDERFELLMSKTEGM